MPKTEGRLNIRIDNKLKEQAKETLDEIGLDMTTAVTIYLKQIVREGAIPFRLTKFTPETLQAIKELNEGDTETFNNIEDLWSDLNDED